MQLHRIHTLTIVNPTTILILTVTVYTYSVSGFLICSSQATATNSDQVLSL